MGASKHRIAFLILGCTWITPLAVGPLQAADKPVIVGVNVVGVNQLSETQQDALVAQLRRDEVTTVRTGFGVDFQHFVCTGPSPCSWMP
jgi:hypothetical protein